MIVKCEECGTYFPAELNQIKRGKKFCSKICYSRWQKNKRPIALEKYYKVHSHPNQGNHLTTGTKNKISQSLTGHPVFKKTRKKIGIKSKQYKRTPQHIEAMLKGLKTLWGKAMPKAVREKIAKANTGKHPTKKTIMKLRLSHIKNNYKEVNAKRYNLWEAKQWRKAVFERDNYTCRECGKKSGELQAHHIISFSSIVQKYKLKTVEDLRKCKELWDVKNGLTLCLECHKKTPGYAQKMPK